VEADTYDDGHNIGLLLYHQSQFQEEDSKHWENQRKQCFRHFHLLIMTTHRQWIRKVEIAVVALPDQYI
jgi:hypothetical protein